MLKCLLDWIWHVKLSYISYKGPTKFNLQGGGYDLFLSRPNFFFIYRPSKNILFSPLFALHDKLFFSFKFYFTFYSRNLTQDYLFPVPRVRLFFSIPKSQIFSPQIILKLKAFIIKITVYHIDERTATLLVTHNESLKCLQEIHMKTHLLHATFCHFLISQHCYFCAILSCYLEFLSIFTTRKT